jgi:hypothetical protein
MAKTLNGQNGVTAVGDIVKYSIGEVTRNATRNQKRQAGNTQASEGSDSQFFSSQHFTSEPPEPLVTPKLAVYG